MIDLQLDQGHDIELVSGDMKHVVDADEVIQSTKIRLLTQYLEWKFQVLLGIQWIDSNGMFDPAVPQNRKEAIVRRTILSTPGLLNLTFFSFEVDPINRGAAIAFTAQTIFGKLDLEVTI